MIYNVKRYIIYLFKPKLTGRFSLCPDRLAGLKALRRSKFYELTSACFGSTCGYREQATACDVLLLPLSNSIGDAYLRPCTLQILPALHFEPFGFPRIQSVCKYFRTERSSPHMSRRGELTLHNEWPYGAVTF